MAPAAWAGFTIFRTAETGYDSMGRKVRESLREGAAGPVRALAQSSYDPLGRPHRRIEKLERDHSPHLTRLGPA